MMDGTTLQSKIYYGYAKSASVIGTQFMQYRPTGPLLPVQSPNNFVQYIDAAFDNLPAWSFTTSQAYGKPLWYPLIDGTQIQVGDLLVGQKYSYVIAEMPFIDPIAAFLANATFTVKRPVSETGVGAQPYGGDYAPEETLIMNQFPASLLQGTKGEKGDTNLPGDVRMPWFTGLVAHYPGVEIKTFDVIYDQLGRRFKVSSAELTPRGWRLTLMMAQT